MDGINNLVRKKRNIKYCPRCATKLSYTAIMGKYHCKACGYSELDLYGQMKDLLEENPSLSKVEMSMILDVPIRDLSPYIENGVLSNPQKDIP